MPLLSVGGKGVISVIANVMPKEMVEMYKETVSGNFKRAMELNKELIDLNKALSLESNPIPVKYALYKMGKMKNELRLPLTPMVDKNTAIMDKVLKVLDII